MDRASKVSSVPSHGVAGGLRTSPLPSAEVAGDGQVYVAWEDCRFRQRCTSNDIVFARSTDGVNWSDPARVPIDAVTSTVDHFIPGLAVDPATSGAGTHLALTYYFYPNAELRRACRLEVGYISSPDGGAHWGAPTQLAGPMALSEIAATSQGPMVGDYISTSFSGGKATTVFAVGRRSRRRPPSTRRCTHRPPPRWRPRPRGLGPRHQRRCARAGDGRRLRNRTPGTTTE